MSAVAQDFTHALLQCCAIVGDGFQGVGFVQNFQCFLRCGQRNRMAGIGAAMDHAIADLAHDVLTPGHYRYGVAVTHGLGEGAQVGLEAHQFLHAAPGHPEAGFDLVDNHHDVVLVTQFTGCQHVFPVAVMEQQLPMMGSIRKAPMSW